MPSTTFLPNLSLQPKADHLLWLTEYLMPNIQRPFSVDPSGLVTPPCSAFPRTLYSNHSSIPLLEGDIAPAIWFADWAWRTCGRHLELALLFYPRNSPWMASLDLNGCHSQKPTPSSPTGGSHSPVHHNQPMQRSIIQQN